MNESGSSTTSISVIYSGKEKNCRETRGIRCDFVNSMMFHVTYSGYYVLGRNCRKKLNSAREKKKEEGDAFDSK